MRSTSTRTSSLPYLWIPSLWHRSLASGLEADVDVSAWIMYNEGMTTMTVREAMAVHRTAARNVGKGKGYTARRLDEALAVLNPFWNANGVLVTEEMIDAWDKKGGEGNGQGNEEKADSA